MSRMSDKPAAQKRTQPKWLSMTLRILTYIRVPLLCIVALFIGLWIGYVKLGGQATSEIFQVSTWKHLYDLVFAS